MKDNIMNKKNSSLIKRIIIRRPKICNYIINIASKLPKRIIYKIGHKVCRSPSENLAIPGTLEENLQSPETYLEVSNKVQIEDYKNTNKIASKKYLNILNPSCIYDKAKSEENKRNIMSSKNILNLILPIKLSFKQVNSSYHKNCPTSNEENIKLKEVKDEILEKKYEEANKRINGRLLLSNGFNTTKLMKEFGETKQERFLQAYEINLRKCNNCIERGCTSIGRRSSESIVTRSGTYRAKVEEASVKLTEVITESQKWQLGLRNYGDLKEKRHNFWPIGNNINGLWGRIIDDSNRLPVIIRTPENYKEKNKRQLLKDKYSLKRKSADEQKLSNLVVT